MKIVISLFLIIFKITLVISSKRVTRLAPLAENAKPGEFPYLVSIQVYKSHNCGGSLITRTHVLTAAHCVRDLVAAPLYPMNQVKYVIVEVGGTVLGQGVKHYVRRLSYHRYFENFDDSMIFSPNDIGMVTLLGPVTLTDYVKTIPLPQSNMRLPAGTSVEVCGFGSEMAGAPSSRFLRKTTMFLDSHRDCDLYYMNYREKRIVPRYHTCAKRGYYYGTCKGDSGGPLIYNNNTLIGIVSGGDGECSNGQADVFTRVASYLDYIEYEKNYNFANGQESSALAIGKDFDHNQNAMNPSIRFPYEYETVDPIQQQYFPEFSQMLSPAELQHYTELPPYVDPVTGFVYFT